ncbi:MAG: preprotein translocase subunit YajC [Oscillospiraceae bacterium]|nr:preprotein translocase subunit YajC [Oscillospiraceae bacterium]
MFNLFLTTETPGAGSMLRSFLPLALVLVVFYFMLIRPQNKKTKEEANMRSNLQIGDEIVTYGGIIGIIVSIKDDTLVIETGNERSKIRILRKAVESCLTVHED